MLPIRRSTETVCEYEVQFHQRLEQERAQWNQYREAMERELGDLRRRLTEGQEEENLEDEMKKVGSPPSFLFFQSYSGNVIVSRRLDASSKFEALTMLSTALRWQINVLWYFFLFVFDVVKLKS